MHFLIASDILAISIFENGDFWFSLFLKINFLVEGSWLVNFGKRSFEFLVF